MRYSASTADMHPASEPLAGAPDVEENWCVSHKQRYKLKTLRLAPFSCTLRESICGLAVTQRGVRRSDELRGSRLLPTCSSRAEKRRLSAPTMTEAAAAAEVDGSVENGTLILGLFTPKGPVVCLFSSFCHRELLPGRITGRCV